MLVFVVYIDENSQLLWEEEGSNEVRVRRPERDVTLVNVHHVGLGVEAILLSSEVVGERQRCDPTRSAEGDAHVGCGWVVTAGLFDGIAGSGVMWRTWVADS